MLNELALFAGAGGGILGGLLCGFRTVCAVEIEEYPRAVLLQRQNDGIIDPFPVWDDVCTFDGRPWRGYVDIITGGFPCQDISAAGKGAGITGERSGLWKEFARIIGEVRPSYALIENSPMLVTRGLDVVLCDLAALGYDARWGVVSAENAGAPHKRERIWIVGDSKKIRGNRGAVHGRNNDKTLDGETTNLFESTGETSNNVADSDKAQCERWGMARRVREKHANPGRTGWWGVEPDVGRVADGVAARVDRLAAIGNGQVPAVVKLAWEILTED